MLVATEVFPATSLCLTAIVFVPSPAVRIMIMLKILAALQVPEAAAVMLPVIVTVALASQVPAIVWVRLLKVVDATGLVTMGATGAVVSRT